MTFARLGLLWEQLAGVWAPPLIGAGLIAAVAVWGGFEPLTPALHNAAVASVLAAAVGVALVKLARLRWPTSERARSRIVAPAPLAEEEDRLALGDPALWALHQRQRAEALAAARAGRGGAGLAAADPFALRYAVAVAAALGLLAVGWSTGATRVAHAFQPVRDARDGSQAMLARVGHAAAEALDGWPGAGTARPQPARVERVSATASTITP